jgi:hypothetical protein
MPAGLVSVSHEQHAVEVTCQEIRLIFRECRGHQTHDRIAGLVDSNRIEETFDDDDRARIHRDRSMEIEKDKRLAESRPGIDISVLARQSRGPRTQ